MASGVTGNDYFASDDSPWQQKVILASRSYLGLRQIESTSLDSNILTVNQDANAGFVELFSPFDDNSSHQCSGWLAEDRYCIACPDDKPLWWMVLRWSKMMLLKMAHSYHAKPFILALLPLVVGLLVGYWIGTRQNRRFPEGHSNSQWMGGLFHLVSSSTIFSNWIVNTAIQQERRVDSSTSIVDDPTIAQKEDSTREYLKSDAGDQRESGVDPSKVPQHVAVIMDGNRRYGKAKYGSATKGHWDGSSKLVEFAKWCVAEGVSVLSVYAFSTENWNREPSEVASLMTIISKYCDELRVEALQRNIRIRILLTDPTKVPTSVMGRLRHLEQETVHCTGLAMNICLSYGGRGEIVNAAQSIVRQVTTGRLDVHEVDEEEFSKHLLTSHCGDPDVLLRTSGEMRLSNFLLWQLAYSEMFFINKPWPALVKEDFLEIIRKYSGGRIRRYGK
eukprot:Nitzschia sp. Nitz4//scaffold31_size150131//143291//144700//NITZ4_002855-RA/size150131-augustus-gene-0.10-mRNA-1//1//CDS//3329547740//2016//frame0